MAATQPTKDREEIQFRQLLEEAVTKPGTLMKAYSLFWSYSIGNQILALIQANNRGIPLGPIASFNRWRELGRHVKRGEKAIELCMPVTCKRTVKEEREDGSEARNGSHIQAVRIPSSLVHALADRWRRISGTRDSAWDRARALSALNVEEIWFEM